MPPPPGAHFSQEWGSIDTFGDGTRGAWVEFAREDVETAIRQRAGNPELEPSIALREQAVREFDSQKPAVSSILETATAGLTDNFLSRLAGELDGLSIASRQHIISVQSPSGQFITRDSLAAGQGLWTPPHIAALSEVLAVRQALGTTAKLAKLARQAGSHLSRRLRGRRRGRTIGTNVFIGHGRSPIWRELKDFVEDRLNLPVDEFNRVPVAGVTNIARLSEMMDAAAVALIVMTGEDEQPDGHVRARMNVVHEAGCSRGGWDSPAPSSCWKMTARNSATSRDWDRYDSQEGKFVLRSRKSEKYSNARDCLTPENQPAAHCASRGVEIRSETDSLPLFRRGWQRYPRTLPTSNSC